MGCAIWCCCTTNVSQLLKVQRLAGGNQIMIAAAAATFFNPGDSICAWNPNRRWYGNVRYVAPESPISIDVCKVDGGWKVNETPDMDLIVTYRHRSGALVESTPLTGFRKTSPGAYWHGSSRDIGEVVEFSNQYQWLGTRTGEDYSKGTGAGDL